MAARIAICSASSLSSSTCVRALSRQSDASVSIRHFSHNARVCSSFGRSISPKFSNFSSSSFPSKFVGSTSIGSSISSPASVSTIFSSPFSSLRNFSSRFDRDGLPSPIAPPVNFGFAIVPQQYAYVVERLGKFDRVLEPGFHFLIPVFDTIAYVHSLKEEAVNIPDQQAITLDNVTINIDGVLYIRVVDPKLASYGVSNMYYAMTQLAQTTMRSELGKMTLDKTFAERESLNAAIVHQMNRAAEPWGIKCLRYEIRDILPPQSVKTAMDMQAEAERRKRATILDSEGQQQAEINIADGSRQATALKAQGEADAIITRAKATAQGIEFVSSTLKKNGGQEAAALRLAEQYVKAFGQLAKDTNTMILPANAADPSAMIASALSIYQHVLKRTNDTSKPTSQQTVTADTTNPPTADERAANEALITKILQSNSDNK